MCPRSSSDQLAFFVLGKFDSSELVFYIGGPSIDKYRLPRYERTPINDCNVDNNVTIIYSLSQSSQISNRANPSLLARIGVVGLPNSHDGEFSNRLTGFDEEGSKQTNLWICDEDQTLKVRWSVSTDNVDQKPERFHYDFRDGFHVLTGHAGGYTCCCMEDLSAWNPNSLGTWNPGRSGQRLIFCFGPDGVTNFGTNSDKSAEMLDSLVGKIPVLWRK